MRVRSKFRQCYRKVIHHFMQQNQDYSEYLVKNSANRVCKRCVMDSTAGDITFDAYGICNYCTEFIEKNSGSDLISDDLLKTLVSGIRRAGIRKRYDCIVGVSGGVDSSWVLRSVVQLGLRPLAVHMDNGWNSELAQHNIESLVTALGIDLYTHVINWEEYKVLMQAFLDADVIDVELLYDNAMVSVNYKLAKKYGVEYILAGTNRATEGMRMPPQWNWFKYDKRQINYMAVSSGLGALKTYPAVGMWDIIGYEKINKIKWISFLDYTYYNKEDAIRTLEHEVGYKKYPYKHYESIFTRFYQGFLLPVKFGVDKRRLHLSNLIVTGQMDRLTAVDLLRTMPYESEEALESDKEYFLKKMDWSLNLLNIYLARQPKEHCVYPTERYFWERLFAMKSRLNLKLLLT
jgi:N-acetyl sugar amidotransferase